MSVHCPNGHTSSAEDFCDTCGAKIDPAAQPAPPAAPGPGSAAASAPAAPASQRCPNCDAENRPDALFCEACGYDFTTGALPRGAAPTGSATGAEPSASADPSASPAPSPVPPPIPVEWVAELWVDPDWYAGQLAEEPMPSPGLPVVLPLRVRSALVGRVSASRNIHPDIDCTTDTGVSRRHAQLTTDGSRWFVEDLGSSNGTYVGPAAGPLPSDPIPAGPRQELEPDDRIYLGAWTRIVVRPATEDEKAAAAAESA